MGSILFLIEFNNIMLFEGGYALLFFPQVTMSANPSELHWKNSIFSLKIGPGEVFFNINNCEENYTYFQQF